MSFLSARLKATLQYIHLCITKSKKPLHLSVRAKYTQSSIVSCIGTSMISDHVIKCAKT